MQAMIRSGRRAVLPTFGLALLLAPAPALADHDNTCHPALPPPIILMGDMIIIDQPIVEPEFQTLSLSLTLQVQPDTPDARVHGVVHLVHDRGRTVLVPEQGTGQASCAVGSDGLESIEIILRDPRTGDRVQLQITSAAEAITSTGQYPMRGTVGAVGIEDRLDIRMPGAGRR